MKSTKLLPLLTVLVVQVTGVQLTGGQDTGYNSTTRGCKDKNPLEYNFTDEMTEGHVIYRFDGIQLVSCKGNFFLVENNTVVLAQNLSTVCAASIQCLFNCTTAVNTQLTIGGAIERHKTYTLHFLNTMYTSDAREFAPVKSKLAIFPPIEVVIDECGDNVTSSNTNFFTLLQGGGDNFQWRAETSTDSLYVMKEPDYERKTSFTLQLFCNNSYFKGNDTTEIHINVIDVDDEDPKFDCTVYTLKLKEEDSSAVNVWIKTSPRVFAYDQDRGINATVIYSILNQSDPELFRIDRENGSISVTRQLDRETAAVHIIIIQATQLDNVMRTATATVKVDVLDIDDNPPTFYVNYTVNVTEQTDVGTFVAKVTAIDKDEGTNANFTYKLFGNSLPAYIDPVTGIIRVNDTAGFDREKYVNGILSFQVGTVPLVSDGPTGNQAMVTVSLIDINDNHPTFSDHPFVFTLPNVIAAEVIRKANDSDEGVNAKLLYSLQFVSDRMFTIGSTTGVIEYTETYPGFTFDVLPLRVVATDQGVPSLQTVETIYILQRNIQSDLVPIQTPLNESQIESSKSHIEQEMSFITGLPLKIHGIQQENKGSLLQMKCQNENLARKAVLEAVTNNYPRIVALFYSMVTVDQANENKGTSFGIPEIGLIVVSAVLIVVSVLAVVCFRKRTRCGANSENQSVGNHNPENDVRSSRDQDSRSNTSETSTEMMVLKSHPSPEQVRTKVNTDVPRMEQRHDENVNGNFQRTGITRQKKQQHSQGIKKHDTPVNNVSSDMSREINNGNHWNDFEKSINIARNGANPAQPQFIRNTQVKPNHSAYKSSGKVDRMTTSKHDSVEVHLDKTLIQQSVSLSNENNDYYSDNEEEYPDEPEIDYKIKSVRISDQVLDFERNTILRLKPTEDEESLEANSTNSNLGIMNPMPENRAPIGTFSRRFNRLTLGRQNADNAINDGIETKQETADSDVYDDDINNGGWNIPNTDTENNLQIDTSAGNTHDEFIQYLPCDGEISIPNNYIENTCIESDEEDMSAEDRMCHESRVSDV